MRPQFVSQLLDAQPFHPFRIHVSDGAVYDVPHPEAGRVTAGGLAVVVGAPGFSAPSGERLAYLSFVHITRIEVYYPGEAPAP